MLQSGGTCTDSKSSLLVVMQNGCATGHRVAAPRRAVEQENGNLRVDCPPTFTPGEHESLALTRKFSITGTIRSASPWVPIPPSISHPPHSTWRPQYQRQQKPQLRRVIPKS